MTIGGRCKPAALSRLLAWQRRPRWKLVRMDEQGGGASYGKYRSQKSIRDKTVGW